MYGEVEVSLETKISPVLGQLKSGKAIIIFTRQIKNKINLILFSCQVNIP
ncbi:YheU family protein [Desulfobacula sp.]